MIYKVKESKKLLNYTKKFIKKIDYLKNQYIN